MYAALVSVNIDPAQIDTARSMLNSDVVPMVRRPQASSPATGSDQSTGRGSRSCCSRPRPKPRDGAPRRRPPRRPA